MLEGRERWPRGYERGEMVEGVERRRVRWNLPDVGRKAGGGLAVFLFCACQ